MSADVSSRPDRARSWRRTTALQILGAKQGSNGRQCRFCKCDTRKTRLYGGLWRFCKADHAPSVFPWRPVTVLHAAKALDSCKPVISCHFASSFSKFICKAVTGRHFSADFLRAVCKTVTACHFTSGFAHFVCKAVLGHHLKPLEGR